MGSDIVTGLGLVFLAFGVFTFFTAVLGLFRFDRALNRMHAAAVGDALGIFCILMGIILFHAPTLASLKALLILVFLWITSPVASHLIAQVETVTNPNLKAECKVEIR
ncbi:MULTISPECIES: monovalent cation/H(+) antiporter subunit G [unclassified Oscillibacter]|uniref:monovalent cation/H(+) antiporter subunit G n=1 Tax=unclassified Oscillibacter TaxID=2629304 RepID=UPI0025E6659A|nr:MULTISPECIES: monovalent cation/H(+) antiporter subunit G [unclassified Oscillibacter]